MPTINKMVSFVVPTLNRGHYVLRAIESCLQAGEQVTGIDVEVIVSDAGSSDGSWEILMDRFRTDRQVRLFRSPAGSGPMENWLNGARHVKGDFATFVWSDDYIAPHFLTDLLPPLLDGAAVAIGKGAERDVNSNVPLSFNPKKHAIPVKHFLLGYMARGTMDELSRPLSPTCSLFARAVFDQWVDIASRWSIENPLRRAVLWRRAIGPDLLLYMVAIAKTNGPVWITASETAQFSRHAGSITSTSRRLPFEIGYWIAKLWYLSQEKLAPDTQSYVAFAAANFAYGAVLTAAAHLCATDLPTRKYLIDELRLLLAGVSRNRVGVRFGLALAAEAVKTPFRIARYAATRGIRKPISE